MKIALKFVALSRVFLVNMKNKKGSEEKKAPVELIFAGIILALFLLMTGGKIENRGVKQDIVENQIALLIESGVPGMTFRISKVNPNGNINDLRLENSRVYVKLDGLASQSGRKYFSRYNVSLEDDVTKYIVRIT